jgi:hypothetical protein
VYGSVRPIAVSTAYRTCNGPWCVARVVPSENTLVVLFSPLADLCFGTIWGSIQLSSHHPLLTTYEPISCLYEVHCATAAASRDWLQGSVGSFSYFVQLMQSSLAFETVGYREYNIS